MRRLDVGSCCLLLAHVAEDLVEVLAFVLATDDMNPIIASVGGFRNQLAEVRLMLWEVEPLLGKLHNCVTLVVISI